MGGYATDINGNTDFDSLYTADRETADRMTADVATLIEKLNLTQRQATVIDLRMRGYGFRAIGTYLGVHHSNVVRIMRQIQSKCESIGFTPAMWAEMTADK